MRCSGHARARQDIRDAAGQGARPARSRRLGTAFRRDRRGLVIWHHVLNQRSQWLARLGSSQAAFWEASQSRIGYPSALAAPGAGRGRSDGTPSISGARAPAARGAKSGRHHACPTARAHLSLENAGASVFLGRRSFGVEIVGLTARMSDHMRENTHKILILLIWLGVASAAAPIMANDGLECFSKYTRTNVCAYARDAQAKFASILPMQISQNVTVVSAAALGPMLMITARWELTKVDLDQRLLANRMSRAQLEANMLSLAQNNACGSPQMAAFVRLGGKVRWSYNTSDHFPIASPTIDACPSS